MQRFDARNTVLFQERVDQQHRAKGNKDIFPKEDRDVVTRGGMGFDFVADVLRQLAVFVQRRPFGHRRQQRTHRLGMTAQRHQPQRGGAFTGDKIEHQNTRRGRAGDLRHPGLGALLEPVIFQQTNHGQNQNEGRQGSAIHELFAKGLQQHPEIHPDQQTRRQPRHHDHQQRVEAQCKTNNHDRYPDQRQQRSTVHNVYPIQSERCAPTAIFLFCGERCCVFRQVSENLR